MLEAALLAFTTFFAVIGPVDSAVLVASLTPNLTRAERRAVSVKAVFIATIIILVFALVGEPVLRQLGVCLLYTSPSPRDFSCNLVCRHHH